MRDMRGSLQLEKGAFNLKRPETTERRFGPKHVETKILLNRGNIDNATKSCGLHKAVRTFAPRQDGVDFTLQSALRLPNVDGCEHL